ncbi:MAG TPA: hypothetical protein VGM88_27975 [Kofleriaceae bacterium]
MIREQTAPIDLLRVSDEYRAWNTILIDELFPVGRHGAPVYMAVHDGLINDLGSRHHRGTRDNFVADVLTVTRAGGTPFFVELSMLEEIWQARKFKEPPFVAGLALAVLAVGDIATDDRSYYGRLNTLLGVAGRDRPESFDSTVDMWRSLRDWLRQQRRGELVLHGIDGHRPAIELVKAQCLVRSSEIPALANAIRSFSGMTLDLEPENIVPALARYIAGQGSQSRLARTLGQPPDALGLLRAAEALCFAMDSYEPQEPERTGAGAVVARARATLAVRPNQFPTRMWKRAQWLLRTHAAPSAEEPECMVLVGNEVRIARLDIREPATYDAPLSSDEVARISRGELHVQDDQGLDITPHLDRVLWFRDGVVRGRPGSWEIVSSPTAEELHAVVALSGEALQAALGAAVDPGQRLALDDPWPGAGLAAAAFVKFAAGARLPDNSAVATPSETLLLQGGLVLRRCVYLRGGLPNAATAAVLRVAAVNDGVQGDSQTINGGELAQLELPEGAYRLESEEGSADIFVAEPLWRECYPVEDAAVDRSISSCLVGAELRGSQLNVLAQLYVDYVKPGTSYRLYTTSMRKAEAPAAAGIQEILSKSPIRQLVVSRVVPSVRPLPPADVFVESEDSVQSTPDATAQMDRLLAYISARGQGGVRRLRAFCASLDPEHAWHGALTALEDLGHMDVCWDNGRWFGAPAIVVPRCSSTGLSFLAGARTSDTVSILAELRVRARTSDRVLDAGRQRMPSCIVGPSEDFARAAADLEDLRVRVMPESPTFALATQSKTVEDPGWWLGAEFHPSPRVRPSLDRWDPLQLRWWHYPENAEINGPALYRWREQGLVVHYLWTPTLRGRVKDPAAAKWTLAPRDRSYVLYEPHEERLWIPSAMGLPRVLRRACTLAAGLAPFRYARCLAFEGVPLALARAVAVRLNQARAEGLW